MRRPPVSVNISAARAVMDFSSRRRRFISALVTCGFSRAAAVRAWDRYAGDRQSAEGIERDIRAVRAMLLDTADDRSGPRRAQRAGVLER